MTEAAQDAVRAAAHHWRAKLAFGALTPAEREAFDAWMAADPRHGAVYAEAEALWRALGDVDYPPELDKPLMSETVRAAASGIFRGLRGQTAQTFGLLAGAVAAALAVFIFVPHTENHAAPPQAVVYQTAKSELKNVTLPDGTAVTLGAESRLSASMDETRRSVALISGEAYFDIVPDAARPFEVAAGAALVRALGTAFDVQINAETVNVAVAEGVVEVSHRSEADEPQPPAASRVTLAAGRQVSVSTRSGVGAATEVDSNDLAAWRSGVLVYYGASLAEIVADANRYADRPIMVLDGAAALKLSGAFNANDIDAMLAAMAEALPITIIDNGAAGLAIISAS